ncbi:uncharacterized protein [Bemisia tabaci]|uniref:uncharacterized protein isoform X2 n=1 Tax=Bemisia tabaci TaxID=7038 RepID=UPI0008F9D063|nr:PREDICTED: ankyrin repeat domain-containing protein 29-like isoform X2 [Bemisia tabaci]
MNVVHHECDSSKYKMSAGGRQDLVKPITVKKNKISPTPIHFHQQPKSVIIPSSSWQGGSRESAFQPYRPSSTPVFTNLQRGNTEKDNIEPQDVAESGWHTASGMGDLTATQITSAGSERNIEVKDENGMTALIWASTYGQLPTIERLVNAGANVNNVCPKGYTALLLASYNGHFEVVRYLLAFGANVNYSDESGNTALMYAAHSDHPHVANELLLKGANILSENRQKDTCYSIAVKRKSKSVQNVLDMYLITLMSS